jgi:hypothetical protein
MTEDEFTVGLRAFARRKPFRHFLVEFFNDAAVRVRHPEGIAPFAGAWLFQEPAGDRVVFASSSVCRLLDASPVSVD